MLVIYNSFLKKQHTLSILILVSLSMRMASSRYSRLSWMAWMRASHWAWTRRSNSMQDSWLRMRYGDLAELRTFSPVFSHLPWLCRSCLWAAGWTRSWNVPSPTIVADCVRAPSAKKYEGYAKISREDNDISAKIKMRNRAGMQCGVIKVYGFGYGFFYGNF